MASNDSVVTIDSLPVEDLLRRLLGESVAIRSAKALAGGHYNITVGIVLTDGQRVVLRAAPRESDQFCSELHLLRNELAAAPTLRSLVSIPEVLASDTSHRFIDRDLVLQSWMPGVPAAEALAIGGDSAALAIWQQIGQVLRRFHRHPGERFGRFVGPQTVTWTDQLASSFAALERDFASSSLDPTPIRICRQAVTHSRAILDTVEPRLLHGDLGPGNVMVRSATDPTIIGLIDCDRSWWGDPAADWTFFLVNRRRADQQQAFWTGYGSLASAGAHSEPDGVRSLLYLARSAAEASLELRRLGEVTKLHASQENLIALTRRLALSKSG